MKDAFFHARQSEGYLSNYIEIYGFPWHHLASYAPNENKISYG